MAGSRPQRAAVDSPAPVAAKGHWQHFRQYLVDGVLWTLGGLGLLSLLAAVSAHLFGFSIVLFSTGSMSPAIPAGSAALVRLLPASEFKVGDVATVERQSALPITHRITSIKPLDGSPSARVITMRGDANDLDDPQPYLIHEARLVVASIPGVAGTIYGFRDPRLMGLLTLVAGGLVTWAFWPRQARKATMVAAAVVVAGSQLFGATDAQAAETERQVVGSHLVLTIVSDDTALATMAPGLPVLWQVGVNTLADEEGAVHIGLGLAPGNVDAGALTVDVRACSERWLSGTCPGLTQDWVSSTPLDLAFLPSTQLGTKELGATAAGTPVWILVRATLTGTGEGVNATLRIAAWGSGEVVDAEFDSGDGDRHGGLAHTGSDGTFETLALAGGAIGIGLVLAWLAGRRRRDTDREVAR